MNYKYLRKVEVSFYVVKLVINLTSDNVHFQKVSLNDS